MYIHVWWLEQRHHEKTLVKPQKTGGISNILLHKPQNSIPLPTAPSTQNGRKTNWDLGCNPVSEISVTSGMWSSSISLWYLNNHGPYHYNPKGGSWRTQFTVHLINIMCFLLLTAKRIIHIWLTSKIHFTNLIPFQHNKNAKSPFPTCSILKSLFTGHPIKHLHFTTGLFWWLYLVHIWWMVPGKSEWYICRTKLFFIPFCACNEPINQCFTNDSTKLWNELKMGGWRLDHFSRCRMSSNQETVKPPSSHPQ